LPSSNELPSRKNVVQYSFHIEGQFMRKREEFQKLIDSISKRFAESKEPLFKAILECFDR
jgi:hypothetical protein